MRTVDAQSLSEIAIRNFEKSKNRHSRSPLWTLRITNNKLPVQFYDVNGVGNIYSSIESTESLWNQKKYALNKEIGSSKLQPGSTLSKSKDRKVVVYLQKSIYYRLRFRSASPLRLHKCIARFVIDSWVSCFMHGVKCESNNISRVTASRAGTWPKLQLP